MEIKIIMICMNINSEISILSCINDATYHDVNSIMNRDMNYSWRKASQCQPRCFQEILETVRILFNEFIFKVKWICNGLD